MLTLNRGESILENVFLVSRESSLTGLCCLLVELRITLELKTWICEVWYLVWSWWCLVSSSRNAELDLGCSISNRWVSLRCWRCRSSCRLGKGEDKKVSKVICQSFLFSFSKKNKSNPPLYFYNLMYTLILSSSHIFIFLQASIS